MRSWWWIDARRISRRPLRSPCTSSVCYPVDFLGCHPLDPATAGRDSRRLGNRHWPQLHAADAGLGAALVSAARRRFELAVREACAQVIRAAEARLAPP